LKLQYRVLVAVIAPRPRCKKIKILGKLLPKQS